MGKRKWDPSKGPLRPWLKDQVKSVIDALDQSAPHRREVGFSEDEGRESFDNKREASFITAQTSNPEEIVLKKEASEQAERKINDLFQAVSGEADLEEVLEAILDDCEPKPRYLAVKLDAPVTDINNRLKRLRRRALKGKRNDKTKTN